MDAGRFSDAIFSHQTCVLRNCIGLGAFPTRNVRFFGGKADLGDDPLILRISLTGGTWKPSHLDPITV